MAEQTPPGPKTSGRIAGIIAIVVLVVGGYYGLIAKPASKSDATVADAEKAAVPEAAPQSSAPAASTDAAPSSADGQAKPTESASAVPSASPTGESAKAGEAPKVGENANSGETVKTGPTFDVVRVEPSGETVVAGLADPKAKVEVLDGSAPIGETKANERGEWAIAIDKPLAPGTHDLSIRATSPDGKTESFSGQRVAVEVAKPGDGEPLVVLNEPDAPSRVLQKPAAEPTPQVAEQIAPPAGEGAAPGTTADNQTAETTPAPGAAGSDASGQTKTATAQANTTPAPDGAAASAGANGAATTAQSGAASAPAAPATGETATAENKPAPTTGTDVATTPRVTVDAVEFEDGKLYIAGSAATGQTVRIYVDGTLVGEAKPGVGGRWLLEVSRAVSPGRHNVRVDQVEEGTGQVIVRAEVPFDRTEDVAALAPVTTAGSGSGGANASGDVPAPQSVIIRRGDNLWRISRRLYGRGVRFSTIYEANNDQIRDPHWIYPGQIFVLPAGDTGWTN
ncbi:LysM peptidoglycan-binding domain-containing protein [Kaistia dalseonensis]|uniref:Nucleoid-associated protein YgaU n=1 Tax=Kaistia dalseonensis TaxID=410840 RepID=A0ABU0H2S9_9HYPH|nr:LysM peptidoglycan-binding domain-containing protein [Kaistia dalseonensis]MCX5493797.1 LysM peptidoglycan-binding domain-containing protein [Kaistia dalseonensis]MDQ0436362.1 nucleoid-associated protein YgaU [Kaistia dalseonensis]